MAITLTEKAAVRIRKLFEMHKMPEGSCLRIGVKGGGCSGFNYTLDVTEKPAADDEVFESHGVKVVVDPKSYLFINGTEVDYQDEMLKQSFVFNNPNAKHKCGCGSSFSA
jgi:iron-sulfur cluster assembly protein